MKADERASAEVLRRLLAYECRNVTRIERDGSWPIVWRKARGCQVWDEDHRRYLDLTAAFGVAAAGHANPAVVRAACRQMACLMHAMGDVHPHARKAELAERLSGLTFGRWTTRSSGSRPTGGVEGGGAGKVVFGNSGFEAVEAALKTAMLATGRPGVLAFEGAYHGLGYGALNATHRLHFRSPFRRQLREFACFVPFPCSPDAMGGVGRAIERQLKRGGVGAVLVEPIQGRAGIRVPPPEFLPELRRLCDRYGALLILDEIYTGFGRTGRWFACEHATVVPDVICLGKALTGGFPLSACVGRAALMDAAWPPATGEAIHTSTFLGHPVGCAMALAQLDQVERLGLVERSATEGRFLLDALRALQSPGFLRLEARGCGLMAGLALTTAGGEPATVEGCEIVKEMLRRGFVLLPEGEASNVISFTPPLTITRRQLATAVSALAGVLLSR